jgi:hypothetical protein
MEEARAPGTASLPEQPELRVSSLQVDVDSSRIPRYQPPSDAVQDRAEARLPAPPPAPPPPEVEDASWYAPQSEPATDDGRVRDRTWRNVALVLAVMVVGAPIAYFASGAINVGDDNAQAQRVLQSGSAHTDEIANSFRGPSVPPGLAPTMQGFQAVRDVLAGYGSSLEDLGSRLDTDIASLTIVDDRLKSDSANPILWGYRSQLANEQRRVEALLAGLKSARSGIGIIAGQAAAFVALFDLVESLEQLVPYLNSRDLNGLLAHYPNVDQRMQALVAAVSGSSFSPHFVSAVNHMKTMTDDLRVLLQGVEYRNVVVVQEMLPKIKADESALSGDDMSDMGPFEQNLLQPYIDGYNSGMRAAGFNQTITNQAVTTI